MDIRATPKHAASYHSVTLNFAYSVTCQGENFDDNSDVLWCQWETRTWRGQKSCVSWQRTRLLSTSHKQVLIDWL